MVGVLRFFLVSRFVSPRLTYLSPCFLVHHQCSSLARSFFPHWIFYFLDSLRFSDSLAFFPNLWIAHLDHVLPPVSSSMPAPALTGLSKPPRCFSDFLPPPFSRSIFLLFVFGCPYRIPLASSLLDAALPHDAFYQPRLVSPFFIIFPPLIIAFLAPPCGVFFLRRFLCPLDRNAPRPACVLVSAVPPAAFLPFVSFLLWEPCWFLRCVVAGIIVSTHV